MKIPSLEERMRVWDAIYARGDPYPDEPIKPIIEFAKGLSPSSIILDLGGGSGRNAIYLSSLGHCVIVHDISRVALKICLQKARKRGMRIIPVHGSLHDLPYLDDAFDALISVGALNFCTMAEIRMAVGEIARVCREGAKVYLALISRKDSRYCAEREVEEGSCVMNDGRIAHFFSVKEAKDLFSPLGTLRILERKYDRGISYGESIDVYVTIKKKR